MKKEVRIKFFWMNYRSGEFGYTLNESVAKQMATKDYITVTKYTEIKEKLT